MILLKMKKLKKPRFINVFITVCEQLDFCTGETISPKYIEKKERCEIVYESKKTNCIYVVYNDMLYAYCLDDEGVKFEYCYD